MSNNPYSPQNPYPPQSPFSQQSQIPTQGGGGYGFPPKQGMEPSEKDYLALRFNRLIAQIIDGLIIGVCAVPVFLFIGFMLVAANGGGAPAGLDEDNPLFSIGSTILSYILWLLINGYFLVTDGQTIGKKCMGIQIVDANSGLLLSFVRVFVIRMMWSLPLTLIAAFVPGGIDDLVLGLVTFIGILMIFGDQRRCLHDHLAGSIVVEYRPGRAHA